MSIPIQTDNSVQLSYSSFPFTITNVDNYATSNFVLSLSLNNSNYTTQTSNVLRGLINTKQDTLTAETNILGIGSSISALDYAKITLNKPTNFQADWNTTISNKPIIYTQTETNTLLNAKQNTLTASTILSGIGSNLTLINYSNLFNLPSTFPPNMSNIYSRTESDNRYLQLTGGTLTNNLNVNANISTQQLYINNPTSTASIIFSPNPSIYSIFSRRVPWAMYFAEDYNASSPTVLPNYINNSRDATLGGTAVSKTTLAGNGALGAITYISGTTTSTITFPTGSIPPTFTILGLTRYTGPTRGRILQAKQTLNWLHGHWGYQGAKRGMVYYEGWKTQLSTSVGTLDDWLCCIGKNVGETSGNILIDGVGLGTASGGTGSSSVQLCVNGSAFNEPSDWALSCVMIWDTALTDAEMVDLNTIVNTYRNDGVSIKSLINSTIDDDSIIESRVYDGIEKTELLLFKGNDGTGVKGADRIRLKAGNIAFDTYSNLTPSGNRNNENIVMLINENGNVGIGTTTNLTSKLNVNGSINSTSLLQNGTQIDFNSYLLKSGGVMTGAISFAVNIWNKSATDNLDRLLFSSNSTIYLRIGDATGSKFIIFDNGYQDIFNVSKTGIINDNKVSTFGGAISFAVNIWNKSATDNLDRLLFSSNSSIYLRIGDATGSKFIIFDNGYQDIFNVSKTGIINDNKVSTFGGSIKTTDLTLYNSTTSTYQLLISGPSSTGPAIIQTIQQGVGYNQNIVFQNSGGNVGIGTLTNITEKLFVNGNVKATNLIASTRITAEGDVRSPNFTAYNSAAISYEISMTAPTATGPATIQTIQQGTGWNQSLTIQAIGNGTVSIGTTSVGTYKLNVNGSLNATTIWQNGTELNTLLNAKQNTLTASTTLLGVGSSITALDYNKITLNVPSTFPPTMTNIYSKTETDNLLNTKQNTLTATTNLLGIGSSITALDYNKITLNVPSTFPPTMTNIYTKTETNTLLDAKQNTLTAATNLLGIGSSITALDYNKITLNVPTTFPPTMTNIYSKTESDGRYIQITGGDITSGTLKFGSRIEDYLINLYGTNSYGFGINSSMLRYNSAGNHTFFCAGTQRAQISSTGLSVSGEITNQFWRFTNESDYLRLYTASGNTYFRFAARTLWCAEDLQVGTTASISGILTLNNSLKFKTNVWNTSTDNKNRIYFADNNTTYFQGYAPTTVENAFVFRNSAGTDIFTINDNGNAYFLNKVSARFLTIANTNRDLLGIQFEGTNAGDNNNGVIYCITNTFTGFHRCFTEDELFDISDPQKFKDDYEGRIVVSTGKIATDTTYDINNPDNTEWTTLYDKEGILIEDALPQIELSRKKKDKRVFGVLGSKVRQNNRPERLIINSVGEGGIWVCNSNGNIENGDYITSSDYLGYGEKQDDDLLHNYTVAKATMDCNFELNSNLYNCYEIDDLDSNGDKLKVAFIACTYHCG